MAKWGSWQDNTRKEKRGDAWWIETYYTCSECGIEGYESDKYCHCCGADMYYSPPQTNADRIRAMSDEELVRVLGMMANGNVFDLICDNPKRTIECDSMCVNCIAEWIKQPVEEDDA